jgi:carboxypeptidase Taq
LNSSYNELLEKIKNITILGTAIGNIRWDMETVMPPRGLKLRSEQVALLSVMLHQMKVDKKIGKLLDSASKAKDLNEVEKRNIYLIKKGYDEETKFPEKLVRDIAKQQAVTVNVWKSAKAAKKYSMFKPELAKLIDLTKQSADILMDVNHTKTPYDALLDAYEPKITAVAIDGIFTDLRKNLVELLNKCKAKPDLSVLRSTVPIDAQMKIATLMSEALGYDVTGKNSGGRIDETEHPFTSGYYDDVRITTHYFPEKFSSSIFSVLHETGHALYEQGMNKNWMYQPVGSACSYGIHESQSRTFENIIGRSREFWSFYLPKIKQIARPSLNKLDLDPFIRAMNHVNPSKIRIEADEVTYNLHIIIRFQMERGIISGKMDVSDLPQIWNEKYDEYLGVKISNDSEGVMQDTHWASGLFGYFPSYSLGNIYSGQMFSKYNKDVPDWRECLAKGDLSGVKSWLGKNVYANANLYDPADLIRKITGGPLDARPYMKYLNDKYGKLYEF